MRSWGGACPRAVATPFIFHLFDFFDFLISLIFRKSLGNEGLGRHMPQGHDKPRNEGQGHMPQLRNEGLGRPGPRQAILFLILLILLTFLISLIFPESPEMRACGGACPGAVAQPVYF